MTGELYASECCGAVFVPGHGPDNIIEAPDRDRADARRAVTRELDPRGARFGSGEIKIYRQCPACGEHNPALHQVRGYDE